MKNLLVFLIAVFCLGAMTSCASTYKKRKGCKGNGGWYGKRNLGQITPQQNIQALYVWAPATAEATNF
ncbi:MAG: hypothetical protein ACRBFS_22270 [Aureispira sp.]